jgi:acyl-CoA synthetase (AMP-forming)/AMP-acid ligase II
MTEDDVWSHCKQTLAKYKWPSRISFRKTFPRTSLGKIRKGELR